MNYPYEKTQRFAVVRKRERWVRFWCNFKKLHDTREEAETVAQLMADKYGHKFFVVEILSVATPPVPEETVEAQPGQLQTQG